MARLNCRPLPCQCFPGRAGCSHWRWNPWFPEPPMLVVVAGDGLSRLRRGPHVAPAPTGRRGPAPISEHEDMTTSKPSPASRRLVARPPCSTFPINAGPNIDRPANTTGDPNQSPAWCRVTAPGHRQHARSVDPECLTNCALSAQIECSDAPRLFVYGVRAGADTTALSSMRGRWREVTCHRRSRV
jgi:hypothetical protein